jgi:hypothetical protein
MKRKAALLISVILLSTAFVWDSCKDRRIKGCTDPDSVNFDELAERDDGSCRYTGQAVIWYDETASNGLVNDGATALTFYLNGEVIGSSAASVFWPNAPFCGADGSITVTEDLGKNKAQVFTLSVKDQDSFEYWNTKVTLEGNTCLALKLNWTSRKKK